MTTEATRTERAAWFETQVLDLLPDLYGGARSLCDGRDEVEDLVAEAVARAWERLEDLRDRDRFRGWLFCILRNCCLGRRRKHQARPKEVPLPEEHEDGPRFSLFDRLHQPFLMWWAGGEESFLNGLLAEDLERALAGLPDAYRQAVILADVHEFTYAEIAEALEIPVGTVRSRLARGRAALQEDLWNHAVDAGLREPADQTEESDRNDG